MKLLTLALLAAMLFTLLPAKVSIVSIPTVESYLVECCYE